MTENTAVEIKSPCIGVCAMDDLSGMCQGCYRTIAEIKAWWDMDQGAQKTLLDELEQRQIEAADFDG
jgi:predicted Fe-S protein YdhL (DUF1289 family)